MNPSNVATVLSRFVCHQCGVEFLDTRREPGECPACGCKNLPDNWQTWYGETPKAALASPESAPPFSVTWGLWAECAPVLRDTAMAVLLIIMEGVILGLWVATTESPTPPDFTVLGNLAFLTMLPLAFLIIGCVAGERRWKRIGLVVALFAVFELIGAGTGLSDVSGGLAGLLFIGLGAGVGGGLSYLVAPLYRRR